MVSGRLPGALAQPYRIHEFCRIVINVAVTLRCSKQPLNGLEINVRRRGRNLLREIVAKRQ